MPVNSLLYEPYSVVDTNFAPAFHFNRYTTGAAPGTLTGIFEPNLRLGVKINTDGQLYLDSGFTVGLLADHLFVPPGFGSTSMFFIWPVPLPGKRGVFLVYLGQESDLGDTPLFISSHFDGTNTHLLVFNASNKTVKINYPSSIFPNRNTNGSPTSTDTTLAPGKYVYMWTGGTPLALTALEYTFDIFKPLPDQPVLYLAGSVTGTTTIFPVRSYLGNCFLIRLTPDFSGTYLALVNIDSGALFGEGRNQAGSVALNFLVERVGGQYRADYLNFPSSVTPIDADDPNAISWSGGYSVESCWVDVNANGSSPERGFKLITRGIKIDTNRSIRIAWANALLLYAAGTTWVRRAGAVFRALTDITSYGSANNVVNPGGIQIAAVPDTVEVFDGNRWNLFPGSVAYTFRANHYAVHGRYRPFYVLGDRTTEHYFVQIARFLGGYGNPTITASMGTFGEAYRRGFQVDTTNIFVDYAGGRIPAGNEVGFVIETYTDPNTMPSPDTTIYERITDTPRFYYGGPSLITLTAPDSVNAGQIFTVSINAGSTYANKPYRLYDVDRNSLLAQGILDASGQASAQISVLASTKLRAYAIGDEPA
ncbi:MAG: hypothetical protein C4347_02005 [Patescibacteria group bacterium]